MNRLWYYTLAFLYYIFGNEEYLKLGGVSRSNLWPKVRREHLKNHPHCSVCGKIESVVPHHIKPFAQFPELELDSSNLVSLCESAGMNCHITFGHLGNFRFFNPHVLVDIEIWRRKIIERSSIIN